MRRIAWAATDARRWHEEEYRDTFPGSTTYLAAYEAAARQDEFTLDPEDLVITVVGPLDEIAAGGLDSARCLLGLRSAR